jgi:hypothetical protein
MKNIIIIVILLGLSSCGKRQFDTSEINEIDNLIVNSKFDIKLVDSIYNIYEENDYLNGIKEIVYLYNTTIDSDGNYLYDAPNEYDGTFKVTSLSFSHYFMDYELFKTLVTTKENGRNELLFIRKYSTYLGVDIDDSIFYTVNHYIPIAIKKDTSFTNIWIRICLSKYLMLHQYYNLSLDYLFDAEQINGENLYIKELIIRNYLALDDNTALADYVDDFPDNYKFIDLSQEEVEEINLFFPSKKFKNNEKYIKNLY